MRQTRCSERFILNGCNDSCARGNDKGVDWRPKLPSCTIGYLSAAFAGTKKTISAGVSGFHASPFPSQRFRQAGRRFHQRIVGLQFGRLIGNSP